MVRDEYQRCILIGMYQDGANQGNVIGSKWVCELGRNLVLPARGGVIVNDSQRDPCLASLLKIRHATRLPHDGN